QLHGAQCRQLLCEVALHHGSQESVCQLLIGDGHKASPAAGVGSFFIPSLATQAWQPKFGRRARAYFLFTQQVPPSGLQQPSALRNETIPSASVLSMPFFLRCSSTFQVTCIDSTRTTRCPFVTGFVGNLPGRARLLGMMALLLK